MKKYFNIAFAFLLVAFIRPAFANDFSGYALRGSFGYVNAGFKNTAEIRVPAQGATSNYGGTYAIKSNGNNVSYGVGIGRWFNKSQSTIFGLEVFGLIENAGFNRNSLSMLNQTAPKLIDNLSGKIRGSVAVLFKPGYKFSESFLGYLFVGPKLARFVVNSTSTFDFIGGGAQHYLSSLITSTSSTRGGYCLGLGGQYNFYKKLMLGVEYTFSNYNNVKTAGFASTQVYDINTHALFGDLNKSYGKMSVQTNNISLNLIYNI